MSWAEPEHVSPSLQLPSFRYTRWQRGSGASSVGYMTTDMSRKASSHHRCRRCHPLPPEAPVLPPCLIMWARCLGGLSVPSCCTVSSRMPLSGRLATAAHSLFVSFFWCVCQWRVSPYPQNSFLRIPLTLDYHYFSFTKLRNKKKYEEEGEHAPHCVRALMQKTQMSLSIQTDRCTLNAIPTFVYVPFQFVAYSWG